MNDNNLKRLNRKALLEILLEQAKRIEELEVELEKVNEELKSKNVMISNAGSLAEASLKLSDIFKAADDAVAIQMKNIEVIAQKEERKLKKELRELKKKRLDAIDAKCKKREMEADKHLMEVEKKIEKLNKSIPEVKDKDDKKAKKSTSGVKRKPRK